MNLFRQREKRIRKVHKKIKNMGIVEFMGLIKFFGINTKGEDGQPLEFEVVATALKEKIDSLNDKQLETLVILLKDF